MTPADIQNLIASVGFPIVCCFALFWMINKTLKELSDSIKQNTQATLKLSTTVETLHGKEESQNG